VAGETYARGLRHFLEDELGLPCRFSGGAQGGRPKLTTPRCSELVRHEDAAGAVWQRQRAHVPELKPAAQGPMRAAFIPASFPGAIIRRATGTPFMGYAGATYVVQEVCNALFDALFHILPLGTDMDKRRSHARPAKAPATRTWDDAAQARLQAIVIRANRCWCRSLPPSACATRPSRSRGSPAARA
jgi:3,8-divinyl chlorophyllide a/chlorophyllide a reductase subunit Z